MTNISLVGFYGKKPLSLKILLTNLQQCLIDRDVLNNKFVPYSLEQIHGTLIGCEGWKTNLGVINQWFYRYRNETKYLKLANFIEFLNYNSLLPLNLTFGGYKYNKNYGFSSRNLHPAKRSFQLQKTANNRLIPVLIGWTAIDNKITLDIDRLRKKLQQFNLLHKYHDLKNSIDNDFYLRLGTIQGEFNLKVINNIEIEIRNILQAIDPINIPLTKKDIAFVRYQDSSLPIDTTQVIPLTEITEQKLIELYAPN